jgi:RES domain-containing protein
VEYRLPAEIPAHTIAIGSLPEDWVTRETHSQMIGDEWLERAAEAILVVPSVVMPISSAIDRNVLINHRHEAARRITIVAVTPFTLDPRLFRP